MDDRTDYPFQQVVDALLDPDTPFNPGYLNRLSDLDGEELEAIESAWPQVPTWRRRALLEDIEQLCREDLLLHYSALGGLATRDPDPTVRLLAVRTLWEFEDNDLIPIYMSLLKSDEDTEVRAAAAGALGKYVFAGEIEEVSAQELREIEDLLLKVLNSDQPGVVRRNALEALGFSNRPEVTPFIEKANQSPDEEWIKSGLFAMGRSANENWGPQVISRLDSERTRVRTEAARAAGELELRDAIPQLLLLIYDPDLDVRLASIWSLSQIGGEGISEDLYALYNELDDDEEQEFLDNALENLQFTESMNLLPFFDFPDGEDDDLIDNNGWLDDHQNGDRQNRGDEY